MESTVTPEILVPPLPSKDDVRQTVRTFVAGFANLNVGGVALTMVLRTPPLRLDDNQLVFLATTLRGYVQNFNPAGTVKAADTRKDGQTVQGLGDLVFERIAGQAGVVL